MSNESKWRRSGGRELMDPSHGGSYPLSASGPMGSATPPDEPRQLFGPDGKLLPKPKKPFGFTE